MTAKTKSDKESKLPTPVFVAELDVDNGRDVFAALGLRGAPTIVYVPPKVRRQPISPVFVCVCWKVPCECIGVWMDWLFGCLVGYQLSSLMSNKEMGSWLKTLGAANQFALASDTKLTDLLNWINKLSTKTVAPPAAPLSRYWFTLAPAALVVALFAFYFRTVVFRFGWLWKSLGLIAGFALLGFCWGGGI